MELRRITSKDNEIIKNYKKASTSKKYRDRNNIFVSEGKRLVLDAFKNNILFERILICESSYKKYISELIKLIGKFKTHVVLIDDALGRYISETENTQGVFAICKKPDEIGIENLFDIPKGNFIFLENLQDPGNLGTIFRTADAFGIKAVIMQNCPDIYSPKVVRSAMGSVFRVNKCTIESCEELFENCKKFNVKTFAATLESNSVILKSDTFKNKEISKNLVIIGNEGNGITQDTINAADEKIIIKMVGGAESLNAGIAAGIFMWEMYRQN